MYGSEMSLKLSDNKTQYGHGSISAVTFFVALQKNVTEFRHLMPKALFLYF